MSADGPVDTERVPTGIEGLDEILGGGLPTGRGFLVHGGPGTGKTTLGFQFLYEGLRRDQRVMYVTLLQNRKELEDVLISHGWLLDGVELVELSSDVREAASQQQTIFSPADVELTEAVEAIENAVARYKPHRLVIDSLGELGVLVESAGQLRRQVLRLKQCAEDVGCTALFTSSESEVEDSHLLQTMLHGAIHLTAETPMYGQIHRRVEVGKMRGIEFRSGGHDLCIRTGGLVIYPRLQLNASQVKRQWETIASGNQALDTLLGGGLESGTTCLITGTTGAGKSTLSAQYVQAAADRGDHAAVFCFDERRETYLRRAEGLGLNLAEHLESGRVVLNEIHIGEISAGGLCERIRRSVDDRGARVVVLDSLNGFRLALPGQDILAVHLHELLCYLSRAGALTMMINASSGPLDSTDSLIDASYIADTVVRMRHFEALGRVRRCIAVHKKRHGTHETSIREISLGPGGLIVGEPLTDFVGVLTGQPTYNGRSEQLMKGREHETGGGINNHG